MIDVRRMQAQLSKKGIVQDFSLEHKAESKILHAHSSLKTSAASQLNSRLQTDKTLFWDSIIENLRIMVCYHFGPCHILIE